MIERMPAETDAQWIGRLEAAYRALIPACEQLRTRNEQLEVHLGAAAHAANMPQEYKGGLVAWIKARQAELIAECDLLRAAVDEANADRLSANETWSLTYDDLKVEADASNKQLTEVINERNQSAFYMGASVSLLQRARMAIGDFRDEELIKQIDDHLKAVLEWRYLDNRPPAN